MATAWVGNGLTVKLSRRLKEDHLAQRESALSLPAAKIAPIQPVGYSVCWAPAWPACGAPATATRHPAARPPDYRDEASASARGIRRRG